MWMIQELRIVHRRLNYGYGFAPIDTPESLARNRVGRIPVLGANTMPSEYANQAMKPVNPMRSPAPCSDTRPALRWSDARVRAEADRSYPCKPTITNRTGRRRHKGYGTWNKRDVAY